jgi:hypothetical protein
MNVGSSRTEEARRTFSLPAPVDDGDAGTVDGSQRHAGAGEAQKRHAVGAVADEDGVEHVGGGEGGIDGAGGGRPIGEGGDVPAVGGDVMQRTGAGDPDTLFLTATAVDSRCWTTNLTVL